MAKNTYNGIGDIKTGLLKKSVLKKAFWGKYENQIPSEVKEKNISDSLLLDLQIKKLKMLEESVDFSEANQFIKEANSQEAERLNEEILETSSARAYQRFIELLNAGLWSSEINPIKANAEFHGEEYREKYDAYIESILAEITNILKQLNVNGPTSQTIVNTLEKRLRTMKKDEASIREYVRHKSFFAEYVAAELLNNRPGYRGLVTGNYLNEAGEQLIEDAFSFKNVNLGNKFKNGLAEFTVVFKSGQKVTKKAGSMQDFFKQLENIQGEYTIQLTNGMYDAMREAAALKAQVKSGLSQDILNKAKERNAIELGQIGFFAEGIWELYFEDMAKDNSETWFKEQQYSKTLNTVLNYLLSKSIADTNIKRNEVYFSKDGILTASAWMQLNQRLLKFNPTINKLSVGMLNGKFPYSFAAVS